ncbi:MAG: hypothetical protein ACC633_05185 [Anaerolineales bacterium]
MNEKTTRIIRWIARVWASLMAAMVAFIFIGDAVDDGIGPIFSMTLRDSLMMAAFVATWLGLVLGWKWERLGGSLIVGGMAAFYLFDFAFTGSFTGGPLILMIVVPGFLFLLSSLARGGELNGQSFLESKQDKRY